MKFTQVSNFFSHVFSTYSLFFLTHDEFLKISYGEKYVEINWATQKSEFPLQNRFYIRTTDAITDVQLYMTSYIKRTYILDSSLNSCLTDLKQQTLTQCGPSFNEHVSWMVKML